MLYIVATPIGNLGDITLRALDILRSVDSIICEDTRHASILLNHYQIKKPLLVLNDHNEFHAFLSLIQRLNDGENMAIISDAGTPLISDPGYKLVRECITQNIPVDSLPGPSSVITALTLSGLAPDRFMFVGYPPEKGGKRLKWMEELKNIEATIIMFISPHKMGKDLEDLKTVFGDIEVTLAHELTKIHQSVDSKKISDWLESLKSPKGEYILLLRLS